MTREEQKKGLVCLRPNVRSYCELNITSSDDTGNITTIDLVFLVRTKVVMVIVQQCTLMNAHSFIADEAVGFETCVVSALGIAEKKHMNKQKWLTL